MRKPDASFTPRTVEEAVRHLRETAAWNRVQTNREDMVFTMLSTELILEMCERLMVLTERRETAMQQATETMAQGMGETTRLKTQIAHWKAAAIEGWTRVAGNDVEGRRMAQEAYDRF